MDPPPEYGDCTHVRAIGSSTRIRKEELALARKEALLWPARCGKVDSWAGIGLELSTHATGFSVDGTKFVVCGTAPECQAIDLRTGAVVERVTPDWPNDELSGAPITTTPAVRKLFKGLRAPARHGSFPYRDEFRVSWTFGPRGATLAVTLVALDSGEEEQLQRFPLHTKESDTPIVLEAVNVSPRGGVLELETFSSQGGAGFEVALVNLHAAAARLFQKLARSDPAHAQKWTDKAAAAEEKARPVAREFPS
jgi:hypothetical protein